jgi:KaiC/GvpD/RAD55 family RecA-like ATPase
MPGIALLQDLVQGPVPNGVNILVEYDPATRWIDASFTIAADWLKSGGLVSYNVSTQSPENVRSNLSRLGVNTSPYESEGRFVIVDWYSATLGLKSTEKRSLDSLRAADLSIRFSQTSLKGPPIPDRLRITDSFSVLDRFNPEKAWVEFWISRHIPVASMRKSTAISGMIKGVHSDWAYKTLENAVDGIVDFALEETGGKTRDVMRVRSMRGMRFDRDWHQLAVGDNLEVSISR